MPCALLSLVLIGCGMHFEVQVKETIQQSRFVHASMSEGVFAMYVKINVNQQMLSIEINLYFGKFGQTHVQCNI
jgi:hypothetical protein